ncbi:MAG: endo alpha-1,4 polygalactosaminidase [Hyphomicrobiales bacterium]|nr:endo alpha-1,4 polygalactosaminidase [Hyphomicrobiales bacterium]MCP5370273.1 endo alpha-1,4 polygalactosaminidase [Hyphomicrobiales bacterium]
MLHDRGYRTGLVPAVLAAALCLVPAAPAPAGEADPGRWRPKVGDRWQWQLAGRVNTAYDVEVYDIDLADTPRATIAALHRLGRRVVCYFSAGSAEDWRDDFAKFRAADLGAPVAGWDGERWLDTRSPHVRAIMARRLDLAAAKGCDGVEPDNVDGYLPDNAAGLLLTAETQMDYHRFLVAEAHARGLAVGLKNDIGHVPALAGDFDFAVNEECHAFDECAVYAAFTARGKAVFNAEYDRRFRGGAARAALCRSARAANLRTLVLPRDLDDSFRLSCDPD